MAIKYIVHTTSSYSDLNGNTYHFARITSTKTKKSLVISDVGGTENALHLLFTKDENGRSLVNSYQEIYTVQVWEKRREWARLKQHANGFNGSDLTGTVYEHQVTRKMIRALNRKAS